MVTNAGLTVPTNTVEYDVNYHDPTAIAEFETDVATIVAGMLVAYKNNSSTIVVPCDSSSAPLAIGYALDNRMFDSTYNKQYDYDDAYPTTSTSGGMVRVGLLHKGHKVVAKASSGGVTAGKQVTSTTTDGYVTDTSTAFLGVGLALTSANGVAVVDFIVQS